MSSHLLAQVNIDNLSHITKVECQPVATSPGLDVLRQLVALDDAEEVAAHDAELLVLSLNETTEERKHLVTVFLRHFRVEQVVEAYPQLLDRVL